MDKLNKLSQSIRRSVESVTPLGPHDHKLQIAIDEEKDIVTKFEGLSLEFSESASHFANWCSDIGSVGLDEIATSYKLLTEQTSEAMKAFSIKQENFRVGTLKAIRVREESLYLLRKRRTDLEKKIDEGRKKSKPVEAFETELAGLKRESAAQEADADVYRRKALKEGCLLKYKAFAELGAKLTIIGQYGQFLSEGIPDQRFESPLPVFNGGAVASKIVQDATAALKVPPPATPSPYAFPSFSATTAASPSAQHAPPSSFVPMTAPAVQVQAPAVQDAAPIPGLF